MDPNEVIAQLKEQLDKARAEISKYVEFVPEEPGTLLIMTIVAFILIFGPGGACGFDSYADHQGEVPHSAEH